MSTEWYLFAVQTSLAHASLSRSTKSIDIISAKDRDWPPDNVPPTPIFRPVFHQSPGDHPLPSDVFKRIRKPFDGLKAKTPRSTVSTLSIWASKRPLFVDSLSRVSTKPSVVEMRSLLPAHKTPAPNSTKNNRQRSGTSPMASVTSNTANPIKQNKAIQRRIGEGLISSNTSVSSFTPVPSVSPYPNKSVVSARGTNAHLLGTTSSPRSTLQSKP